MKRRIISMILTSVLVAVMGCNASVATTCSVSSKKMVCNDMHGISVMQMVRDSVEVHHIRTQEEYDRLTPIIENRNGRIIIEIIDATVLDDDGNGSDQFGFYVKYDSRRFSKGDHVRSAFVYNPETNYFDDIVCRVDALIE